MNARSVLTGLHACLRYMYVLKVWMNIGYVRVWAPRYGHGMHVRSY